MTRKIIYLILLPALLSLLAVSCDIFDTNEDEGTKQITINDVSSRITGISSITGAGAELEIQGTDLQDVERVIFGLFAIRQQDIEITSTGIKFIVPSLVALGENDIVLVFPGAERAFTKITVIPRQTISWFDPLYGFTDTVVTVMGTNLDIVSAVKIGDVEATILEPRYADTLRFKVPANAYTDSIVLLSAAGESFSPSSFVVCENSTEYFCLPALNVNGDLELGTIGMQDDDAMAGGSWYFAGKITRCNYQLVASPGNYPGLGKKVVRATVLTLTEFDWQIQMVNEGVVCDSDRCFQYMGKVWADIGGRQVRITGGVSSPGYADMAGDTLLTLRKGWNEFNTRIWHVNGQSWIRIRLQANFGYEVNEGATLMFDAFKVVDVGPRSDSAAAK